MRDLEEVNELDFDNRLYTVDNGKREAQERFSRF